MKRLSYDEYREQLYAVAEDINSRIDGDAYFHSQLSGEFDKMLGDAIQHYIIEEPEEVRRMWACSVFAGAWRQFGAYATRGAMIAVREGSVEILIQALIASSIETRGIDDYRLSFTTLSLVHHSAVLLGVDIEGLFQQAEVYSVSGGGVSGFLNRSEHDKSIQAMGYHQWETPAGMIYWPELESAPPGWCSKP